MKGNLRTGADGCAMVAHRYCTGNRIAAVDIVRILAALTVMYEHLSYFYVNDSTEWYTKIICSVFGDMSPLFFVLAGYFQAREITWKKALVNTWWCLAPFVLWAYLFVVGQCLSHGGDWSYLSQSPLTVLGVHSVFVYDWVIGGTDHYPLNGPLWFMRDLVFLFLLSPLIYRVAKVLFPALLIASLYPALRPFFDKGPTLSLMSVTLFAGGCFLRHLPTAVQQRCLTWTSGKLILSYIAFMLCLLVAQECVLREVYGLMLDNKTIALRLIGLVMMYQSARWLELHVPVVKRIALKYAPVTFLTFAGQAIIFKQCLPTAIKHSVFWSAVTPLLIFAVMAVLFFLLKRWARPLLHLVAHYKLRPDDMQMPPKPRFFEWLRRRASRSPREMTCE